MKALLVILLATILFINCTNKSNQKAVAGESRTAVLKNIIGSFVSRFGDNKIRVLISRAENGVVGGRSIVEDNDRPVGGWVKESKDGIFSVQVREPGDDLYEHCIDRAL